MRRVFADLFTQDKHILSDMISPLVESRFFRITSGLTTRSLNNGLGSLQEFVHIATDLVRFLLTVIWSLS